MRGLSAAYAERGEQAARKRGLLCSSCTVRGERNGCGGRQVNHPTPYKAVTLTTGLMHRSKKHCFHSRIKNTEARLVISIALAAAGVSSITRPRTNGPLPLIVTSTLFPFFLFVTRTRVPYGKFL
jgi:hypothetical protein